MSEPIQEYLPFPTLDIHQNASEDDAIFYMNPVFALNDKVMFVNPSFGDRMESERRHAERRHQMLEQASQYYDQADFGAALSELKEIKRDLEIAGDLTYVSDIDSIIEHCRERISSKIANTVIATPINQIAS